MYRRKQYQIEPLHHNIIKRASTEPCTDPSDSHIARPRWLCGRSVAGGPEVEEEEEETAAAQVEDRELKAGNSNDGRRFKLVEIEGVLGGV